MADVSLITSAGVSLLSWVFSLMGVIVQRLWLWTGGIEFSHVVAALVFFWWSKRQPRSRRSSSSTLTKHSRPAGKTRGSTAKNRTLRSSSDSSFDDNSLYESLNDPQWKIKTPQATMQERKRFFIGCKVNLRVATAKLKDYLVWRETHKRIEEQILPKLQLSGDQDTDDWTVAVAVASISRRERNAKPVPQIARMLYRNGETVLRDREGHRFVQVLPGRMDDRLIGLKTYSLAIALYIDRKLKPESTEHFTVLVDVRAGTGWRNPNGAQLLPFIQHTCSLLLSKFPERLARSMVYPIPPAFEWVWKLVYRCLDPPTAEKIAVFTGPSTIQSPPPSDQMMAYLDQESITQLENTRKSAFVLDPSDKGHIS
jgi:hypothetical protein